LLASIVWDWTVLPSTISFTYARPGPSSLAENVTDSVPRSDVSLIIGPVMLLACGSLTALRLISPPKMRYSHWPAASVQLLLLAPFGSQVALTAQCPASAEIVRFTTFSGENGQEKVPLEATFPANQSP
jgi:hypothetical protein